MELSYNNWSVADVMRAVLPSQVENVTSFTQVGHIAHLNLKPETLPFKGLIGDCHFILLPSLSRILSHILELMQVINIDFYRESILV